MRGDKNYVGESVLAIEQDEGEIHPESHLRWTLFDSTS